MAESLYAAVMNNKELAQQLLAAQRQAAQQGASEGQLADEARKIINAAGISATTQDVAELLARASDAQLSDRELDNVSGGCCNPVCDAITRDGSM